VRKKEPRYFVRGLDLPLMVAPSPRVAPAGRREDCVSDQRVPLDNLIRPPFKKKKGHPSAALMAIMVFELDWRWSTALNRTQKCLVAKFGS
jgi:hypothetical protein